MSKVLTFVARQDARGFAPTANVCAPIIAYAARRDAVAASDYTVEDKGTLLLLRSTNADAYNWLVAHTEPQAHWFGRALVVEHGYIEDFVAQLRVDGFTVDETSG